MATPAGALKDAIALAAEPRERDARLRFARWDGRTWRELVDGPARRLAEAVARDGGLQAARSLAASFLDLAAEGIGRGYIFPATATGAESFFTLAWIELLPRLLPSVPAPRRAAVLAACFNLGENLEASPPWLQRIFVRLCRDISDLTSLEALVATVEKQALAPPARILGNDVALHWIGLQREDRRFLPGPLHFVAPSVVCVHDRLRGREPSRPAVTCAVWLCPSPLVLGALACRDDPAATPERSHALRRHWKGDARVTSIHAAAANDWRAAVALTTSQHLVALLPA